MQPLVILAVKAQRNILLALAHKFRIQESV
jgi:hypothetical protein